VPVSNSVGSRPSSKVVLQSLPARAGEALGGRDGLGVEETKQCYCQAGRNAKVPVLNASVKHLTQTMTVVSA